jgi:hypothetical protein
VDVAATVLNLNSVVYEAVYMMIDELRPERPQCGDVISIVGLFRLHAGSKRNVPIVHSGNLALLPDPHERIPIKDRTIGKMTEVEAYLVEAQTLEGLSGSPVFVHEVTRAQPMLIAAPVPPSWGLAKAFGEAMMLGMYQGAWDGEPGEVLAADSAQRAISAYLSVSA